MKVEVAQRERRAENATKNSSLQIASLEQKKADENVMKLAEDQKHMEDEDAEVLKKVDTLQKGLRDKEQSLQDLDASFLNMMVSRYEKIIGVTCNQSLSTLFPYTTNLLRDGCCSGGRKEFSKKVFFMSPIRDKGVTYSRDICLNSMLLHSTLVFFIGQPPHTSLDLLQILWALHVEYGLSLVGNNKSVIQQTLLKSCFVMAIETGPTWMTPLMEYLYYGTILSEKKEAKRLERSMTHFCIVEGTLYRIGFSQPLLKYLRLTEAEYPLTLEVDAAHYMQKCDRCQLCIDIHIALPNDLNAISISSLLPFVWWRVDILWPPGQVKYLVVALDYFAKWVEVEALA
ncbi:hypothetical protein CR513_17803, partial [Mucuna pruriens]